MVSEKMLSKVRWMGRCLYCDMLSLYTKGLKKGWTTFRVKQATLAQRLGRSIRTIRRLLAELEAHGLIRAIRGQTGNRYEFCRESFGKEEPNLFSEISDGTFSDLGEDIVSVSNGTKCPVPSGHSADCTIREEFNKQQAAAPAAAILSDQDQKTISTLVEFGYPPTEAKKVVAKDSALSSAIVDLAARKSKEKDPRKKIRNLAGFVRQAFIDPARYWLRKLADGTWVEAGYKPKSRRDSIEEEMLARRRQSQERDEVTSFYQPKGA